MATAGDLVLVFAKNRCGSVYYFCFWETISLVNKTALPEKIDSTVALSSRSFSLECRMLWQQSGEDKMSIYEKHMPKLIYYWR